MIVELTTTEIQIIPELNAVNLVITPTFSADSQDLSDYVLTTDDRLSDAREASDVFAWAKEPTKPTYTAEEIGVEEGAEVNVNADWNATTGDAEIKNKPTIPSTPSEVGAEPANVNIQNHIASTSNPHGVTKAQVGLTSVDDTSDANKPVSTAQAAALGLKQDITDNTLDTISKTIVGSINEVRTIALGSDIAIVFDTKTQLDAWLLIPANVATLEIGNLFLIRQVTVPDRWWDGTTDLELEVKIDLTNYYTQSQIDTLLSGKANTVHNHFGQSINPDNIILNKEYTDAEAVALPVGTVFYNVDQLDWVVKTSTDTYYNLGGEVTPTMKNGDSVTHLNGQPVYVSSGTGKLPVVKLANADSEATSYTIAIATQDVVSTGNKRGRYTAFGGVNGVAISNVIKTGESSALWVEGAPLFLATETGKLTTIAPIAPNHRVLVGYITDKSGSNISIFVNTNVGAELGELHDVDLTKSKTTPLDIDNIFIQDSADSNIWKKIPFGGLKTAAVAAQNAITLEPTGFRYPELTVLTGNGDRTVALSGTVEAYWRGVAVPALINGYTSPLHGTDTSKLYFLSYDGASIAWSETAWTFDKLQIAIAKYDLTNGVWYYFREVHGLMPWSTHKELHDNIGTYKSTGGTIPSASYVLNSTVAAERRFNIDSTTINDEDLATVNAALTSKLYNQFRLNGADIAVNTVDAADCISLSGANPYYNQLTGGLWQQTLLPANTAATVWIYALPVASDAVSQKYRYLFVQPQSYTQATNISAGGISTAVSTEKNKLSSELNLNGLLSTEIVAIAKAIIVYTGGDWFIREIIYLTGSKFAQIGSPSTAAVTQQSAYLNSLDPEIDTVNGAMTYKNGNADNTVSVLETKNFSGVLKASINGNGSYNSVADYGTNEAPLLYDSNNWALTSGWIFSGNSLDKNSNGTTTATALLGVAPITIQLYKVTFTVANSVNTGTFVAGVVPSIAGNNFSNINAVGNYTYYIYALNTVKLVFTPTVTGARYSITNISVNKRTDLTADVRVGGDLFLNGNRIMNSNSVTPIMYWNPRGDTTLNNSVAINSTLSVLSAITGSRSNTLNTILQSFRAVAGSGTSAALPAQNSSSFDYNAFAWDTSQKTLIFSEYLQVVYNATVSKARKIFGFKYNTSNPSLIVEKFGMASNGDFSVKGDDILGAESLSNTALTGGTSWAATGNGSVAANNFTHTFAGAGSSTLTQTQAALATALLPNRWYQFTYTLTNTNFVGQAYIGAECSTDRVGLDTSSLTGKVVCFKTSVAPTDFKIYVESTAGVITIDNVSLKQCLSGNIEASGKFTGGGANGLKIDGAGDSTFDTTVTSSNFLSKIFTLWNSAGTFKGIFTQSNTADRTYTLPNVTGNIALEIVQSTNAAHSGTLAIAPNSVVIFTTAFVTGDTLTLSPTAPSSVTTLQECMFVFGIGATLPTSLTLLLTAGVTFKYWGNAAPSLTINKRYTFRLTWETTTLCQVRYDVEL